MSETLTEEQQDALYAQGKHPCERCNETEATVERERRENVVEWLCGQCLKEVEAEDGKFNECTRKWNVVRAEVAGLVATLESKKVEHVSHCEGDCYCGAGEFKELLKDLLSALNRVKTNLPFGVE